VVPMEVRVKAQAQVAAKKGEAGGTA
jgi:hypothetical protein